MIQQADYLIAYYYEDLHDTIHQQISLARRLDDVTVINLAQQDTADYIREYMGKLHEKQQTAMRLREQGATLAEIGARYQISGVGADHYIRSARRQISDQLRSRLRRQLAADGPDTPLTCGIGGLAAVPDAETLTAFEAVVRFLVSQYGVKRILVEQLYSQSPYLLILQKLRRQHKGLRLTLVTHFDTAIWKNNGGLRDQFTGGVDNVLNLDPATRSIRAKTLRTDKQIIDRSDFFLCKLDSTGPLTESIKRYLRSPRQVKVYDLNNTPQLEEVNAH